MLVLSNSFGVRDVSRWHTNIVSLGEESAEGISLHLATLCRRFEGDPAVGDRGRSLRPRLPRRRPQFPFAGEIATLLRPG